MPRIIKSAKGTFTTSTVTIDSSGRVISAATGSAGGANQVPALMVTDGTNGAYTASNNANFGLAYVYGGGGGGGGGGNYPGNEGGDGGPGGEGALGVFGFPISGGESHNYTIGGGGSGGTSAGPITNGNAGSAGQATTLTNIGTANGGGGGGGGPRQGGNVNTPGNAGTAPGSLFVSAVIDAKKVHSGGVPYGGGGAGGPQGNPGGTGQTGSGGALFIYENIGE